MHGSARKIGGGAKRCTLGKSCGATCIDAQERCNLELGPVFQADLPKARQLIGQVKELREKQHAQDVENWSDEKAAKWLKANQQFLEGAQIKLDGGQDAMWLLGNEPGMTKRDIEHSYPLLAQRLVREGKISPNKVDEDLTKIISSEPSLAVRFTREDVETAKLINKAMGEKRDILAELSPNAPAWKLIENGMAPNTMDVAELKAAKRFGGNTFYGKAFKLADELGIKTVAGTNMSLLHSSNEKIWPYGDVFRNAKMDPGPFASRNAWLKHLAQGSRGDNIAKQIIEKKPGKVYLSGANGLGVFSALQKMITTPVMQVDVPWVSKNGKETVSKFLVINLPNSQVVLGPHFTAQLPKVVNDMRVRLLKGERPEGAVTVSEGPKMRQKAVKIAKETAKELAAPKVAAKPDAGAARQKLNGYVQTLKNQGQSSNQIKEQLRKMGLPSELISEVV